MSLLTANNLSIVIGDKPICKNFHFELEVGQRWGVIGGNGVGKTTLLQTLAGLLQPQQGEIIVTDMGIEQWDRKELACKLGILFQDSHDAFPSSVMETALIGRHPYLPFWAFESKDDITMANKALLDVAMEAMSSRQVNTLSGGERRRLAIATLLVQNPLIWLLDEPTNHLDLHHQVSLLELICDRVISVSGGSLMVLHDVNLVTRFCSHAMLMIDDENIICGSVEDIITVESLHRLYRHPVKRIQSNGYSYYVPE